MCRSICLVKVGVVVSKTYLSPIGTSLLANFAREKGSKFSSKYRDLQEWARLPPDDSRNIVDQGEICRAIDDQDLVNDMVDYVVSNKGKSCAEVNGVMSIMSIFSHKVGDIELVFMYTRSCNTMLVEKVLVKALNKLGFSEIREIGLTGISSLERFDEGLVEVLDRVSSIIRDSKVNGRRVYVNATPGFKAETSFIVLVSLILGADGVVYIHESFNKPVVIPAIPLSIRREEIETLLNVFGEENSLDIGVFTNVVGQKDYQEYLDKGLIMLKGGKVYLRPWLRTLLEQT